MPRDMQVEKDSSNRDATAFRFPTKGRSLLGDGAPSGAGLVGRILRSHRIHKRDRNLDHLSTLQFVHRLRVLVACGSLQ